MGFRPLAATAIGPIYTQADINKRESRLMVSIGYLIDKPHAPGAAKRFVDTRLVPAAIDAAGAVECGIYELGQQVRAQPAKSLLLACALGVVLGMTFRSTSRV